MSKNSTTGSEKQLFYCHFNDVTRVAMSLTGSHFCVFMGHVKFSISTGSRRNYGISTYSERWRVLIIEMEIR